MQTLELVRRKYNPLSHYVTITIVFIAFAFSIEWQTIVLVALVIATIFSPKRKIIYRGFMKFVLPLLLIGFVINGIFFPGRIVFSIGPLHFRDQGLLFAAGVGVRLSLIVISISYYFSRVKSEVISEYLASRGADRRLIYIFLLSVAMVHLMRDKLQKIYMAQSARGLDTTRSVFTRARYLLPMLVPLSYSYLSESLDRGIALRAANFSDRNSAGSSAVVPLMEIEADKSGLILGRIILAAAVVIWIAGLIL